MPQPTFNISLPTSWDELSDKQLRMVFHLFARDLSAPEVKTLCLLKWNRLTVIGETAPHVFTIKAKHSPSKLEVALPRQTGEPGGGARGRMSKQGRVSRKRLLLYVTTRQIQAATQVLDFLDELPATPVRLARIGRHRALPADFEKVPFEKYLYLDNLYQGFLHTEDDALLLQMAYVLYDCDKIQATRVELVNVFYWFAALKQYFSRMFPHFYTPIDSGNGNLMGGGSLFEQLREATNAQMRALTGGDITKEQTIRQLDTHRALTELDAKAREAEEYRRSIKK